MTKEAKKLSHEEIVAVEDCLIDFQFAVLDAMQERGITNAKLAEMLGVSRARVSQMLSSEANPTIKLVGRTLHALGLECDYVSVGRSSRDGSMEHNRNREETNADQFALVMSRRKSSNAPAWRRHESACANGNMSEPRKAA